MIYIGIIAEPSGSYDAIGVAEDCASAVDWIRGWLREECGGMRRIVGGTVHFSIIMTNSIDDLTLPVAEDPKAMSRAIRALANAIDLAIPADDP